MFTVQRRTFKMATGKGKNKTELDFEGFNEESIDISSLHNKLVNLDTIVNSHVEIISKLKESNDHLNSKVLCLEGLVKDLRKDKNQLETNCKAMEEENKLLKIALEEVKVNLNINDYNRLGKEIQQEKQLLSAQMEEVTQGIEQCKKDMQLTYAQVAKEKEKIEEAVKEVKHCSNQDKTNIRLEVRKELASNPKLVQNTVDRSKSLIIFGCKEKAITSRSERAVEEAKVVDKIVGLVEGLTNRENVCDYRRIGRYVKGKDRPLRITLNGAKQMEEVLRNARKLQRDEDGKGWSLRRDLSKEDREKLKLNLAEAKHLNESRNEEEINSFFYKVIGVGRPVKWYIKANQQNQ